MPFLGEFASLAAAAVWAVSSLVFARISQHVGPTALNFFKCSLSLGLLLLTRLLLAGTDLPLGWNWEVVAWLSVSGLVGISLGDTAWFVALQRLGARRALLLFTTAPVLTALLAGVVLGDPLTGGMAIGILMTIGGVTWVMLERTPEGTPRSASDGSGLQLGYGVAMGLVAALCQAVGSILTRFAGEGLAALDVSIVRLVVGTLALGVQVTLARELLGLQVALGQPHTRNRLLIATFLGTYLGIWLMNTGLLNAPVGIAATLNATSPLFVLPLSHFVLGERVSPRAVLGACVACLGIAVLFLWGGAGG